MVNHVRFAYLFCCLSFINAVDGKDRKVLARTTPATAQSVVQFVEIQDCLSLQDGIYADPTDCHRYYHCNQGKTYYFRCYEGFVFHPCQLKCSFRDSCITPDSCTKSVNKSSSTVTKSTPFDIQQTLSDDGAVLTEDQRKLLRLAYSLPVLNELESAINSKDGKKSEANVTTDNSSATTKSKPKKRIPAVTNDLDTQTETTPKGTTETALTYIVKVVFARRNQPGISNDINQFSELTTTTALSTSTNDYSIATTAESTNITTSEYSNSTEKNTTLSFTELKLNGTTDANVTTTSEFSRNKSLSEEFMEKFNSSMIENTTLIVNNTDLALLNNDTTTDNGLGLNMTLISINETTNDADNSTSTFDSETSNTTKSDGVIVESNSIEIASAGPAKNFIKESERTTKESKATTKEAEKSTETEKSTKESEKSTKIINEVTTEAIVSNDTTSDQSTNNFTQSLEANSTVTSDANSSLSLESNSTELEANSTTEYSTETTISSLDPITANDTSAEEIVTVERNSTTTVELMQRTGETISNITLSCNPTISSAMCDNFGNQTKESLAQSCRELTCQNGGMFISLSNGHCGCVCPNGFKSDTCLDLVDRSACHCANGGRCVQVANDTFTCMCPLGMLGSQCQYSMTDIHPKVSNLVKLSDEFVVPRSTLEATKNGFKNLILCSTNVCFNGGLCLQNVENLSERKCFCSDNYGGQFCEKTFA